MAPRLQALPLLLLRQLRSSPGLRPLRFPMEPHSVQFNSTPQQMFPAASPTIRSRSSPARVQTLSTTFTPIDAINYTPGTASVMLAVAPPVVSFTISSTQQTYPISANVVVSPQSTRKIASTGTVTIFDGATPLITIPLGGDGKAYWTTNPPSAPAVTHSPSRIAEIKTTPQASLFPPSSPLRRRSPKEHVLLGRNALRRQLHLSGEPQFKRRFRQRLYHLHLRRWHPGSCPRQ